MVNEKIVERFKNEGDTVWANCLEVVDCIIIDADDKSHRIDKDDKKNVRENFKNIGKNEEILFIRDLTFWNNRSQGCVITDRSMHFMLEKNKPEKAFALNWSDIKSIKIDKEKFCITMYDGSKHYIDTNLLIKKKDPSEKMLKRIASFLKEIAELDHSNPLATENNLLEKHSNDVHDHTPTPRKNA